MNLQHLESIFTLVWQASWRAGALIVVVLILQTVAGKRLPARFRYALSLLVLLRLIVLVTPASSWSVFNLTRHVRPALAAAPILSASPAVLVAPTSIHSPVAISRPPRVSPVQWAAIFWLCGGAGFLLVVIWRHRKFGRWVAQLPTAADPLLIELVEQCKGQAGLRRAVRITRTPQGNSAAVFGLLRPCLLLPEGLLDNLERREARLVLLHEFFHIRRRDVLVNWISVLALALHWFNPLAWMAMRRLRADQELACDAAVLGLVEPAERGTYGRTLLKHLYDFPADPMAAGLVPLITLRHNIKRRIIMITEFKNTGNLARAGFAFLTLALGALTFTRAADDPISAAPNTGLAPAATPFMDTSSATAPPKAGQDYGAEYVKQSTLLGQLKDMAGADHPRFIQALSATASDPILNSLVGQELAQETRLAGLKRASRGAETPEVREAMAVINDLKEKIDQRANGIIAGMSLQVAALRAAANDGLRRVQPSDRLFSKSLEDWDHQRVLAMADYLEYSNELFNLNQLTTNKLGGALPTAYAHQLDPELAALAVAVRVAKERMTDVSQTYGANNIQFRMAQKQLEDSQAAYQNKINAVMDGIKTRVNEDKGLLQLYEQKEKDLEATFRKQQAEDRY